MCTSIDFVGRSDNPNCGQHDMQQHHLSNVPAASQPSSPQAYLFRMEPNPAVVWNDTRDKPLGRRKKRKREGKKKGQEQAIPRAPCKPHIPECCTRRLLHHIPQLPREDELPATWHTQCLHMEHATTCWCPGKTLGDPWGLMLSSMRQRNKERRRRRRRSRRRSSRSRRGGTKYATQAMPSHTWAVPQRQQDSGMCKDQINSTAIGASQAAAFNALQGPRPRQTLLGQAPP